MKKLFIFLIILFTLYLGLQFIFNFFSKGADNSYTIVDGNMSFEINEKSFFANKINNYSYSIKTDDLVFNFQINEDFNKESQILKDIKYYKDNKYECILPIFKNNKIVIDMLCYDNQKFTYYYNIKGKNSTLDNYVANIENYNNSTFTDSSKSEKIENLDIYTNNLIKNHYLTITNYKGIYNVSSNFNSIVYNISLFSKDIYNPKISAFVDKYYVTADYNQEFEFHKFNVVDLVKLDTKTITTDYKISLDSYVQGVVDNILYIYDNDYKTQYEINIEKGTVISYKGNNLKYYNNGTWSTMTMAQASEGLKFKYEESDLVDNKYVRIDKIGNEVGYYYMYKKNGNTYDVYSMDIQNNESLKYLFSTQTIDNIYYIDDYIYFVNSNKIQLFNHKFGVKNIIQNKEFQFNKNLKINVYSK